MSKLLTTAKYTGRNIENQWINNVYSSHDLFCGCNDPILHLLTVINKGSQAQKPEEEIQNIKCLITGDPTKITAEDLFEEGELERLFTEDDGTDDCDPGEDAAG
uniref:ORF2 n=1 Tax=Chimpanzee anellovirus TaxID=1743410 RepID=A0A0S2GMJ3_9VIRU|nr:ORF2 [Chimpanzee anellovirus]